MVARDAGGEVGGGVAAGSSFYIVKATSIPSLTILEERLRIRHPLRPLSDVGLGTRDLPRHLSASRSAIWPACGSASNWDPLALHAQPLAAAHLSGLLVGP